MFLTLENLVPNALIELIENNISRTVSYPTIIKYGDLAIKELENIGLDYSVKIARDSSRQFEEYYKNVFDFYEIEDIRYIKLKDNINTNYLRKKFRITIPLNVLAVLVNDNSKQVLGINKNSKILVKKQINKEKKI